MTIPLPRTPRKTAARLAVFLPLLPLLGACSDDEWPDWSVPERIDFHPSLNIDLSDMTRTSTGLYVRDLELGEGPAVSLSDTVDIHYGLWLPNARLIQATWNGNPMRSPSGEPGTPAWIPPLGELIPGWREGVPGMQEGGKRLLVIPPQLAYGPQGSGEIPPNATIIFEVELVEIVGGGG